MKQTDLYAESAFSTIYAFSGGYACFDCSDLYLEFEDEDTVLDEYTPDDMDNAEGDDEDETSIPVLCTLLKCDAASGKTVLLYNFTGEPGTSPVAMYFL